MVGRWNRTNDMVFRKLPYGEDSLLLPCGGQRSCFSFCGTRMLLLTLLQWFMLLSSSLQHVYFHIFNKKVSKGNI